MWYRERTPRGFFGVFFTFFSKKILASDLQWRDRGVIMHCEYERVVQREWSILQDEIACFAHGDGANALAFDEESLRNWIGSRRLWRIRCDDATIGFMAAGVDKNEGTLDFIGLFPDYCNCGIGSASLIWLEENYSVRAWHVYCDDSCDGNEKWGQFFRKNGYILQADGARDGKIHYRKEMILPEIVEEGGNVFEGMQNRGFEAEYFETLSSAGNVRVERIVSRGQVTEDGAYYDQDWTEYVFVLGGTARLEIDGRVHLLRSGDWRCLRPHVRHRVVYTSREPACVWLAIHVREA